MKTETLNLIDFKMAIDTFNRALSEYDKDHGNEFVRDACIQRFEYCYDLSSKMIKRHLKITSSDPSAIEAMNFQDLIRQAYDKGIILNSWEMWWQYRDNRAATSHGYNEAKSIAVVEKLPPFLTELIFLSQALSKIYEA